MNIMKRRLPWLVAGLVSLSAVLLFSSVAISAQEPTISVSKDAKLGQYLTDAAGRTLYFYEGDTKGASNCYKYCAEKFPPFTAKGKLTAGDGLAAAGLGTMKRSTGETQVTYDGHPLYYFVSDMQPGNTSGHASRMAGGSWFAMAPDGKPAKR